MAVRLCSRDIGVPHAPTGARPVLDHDVLAELRPEEGRERAGRIVGHPAWGKWRDDRDRAGGERLRAQRFGN
jgi:hypothetical protein